MRQQGVPAGDPGSSRPSAVQFAAAAMIRARGADVCVGGGLICTLH
jgi:hypothetical protein